MYLVGGTWIVQRLEDAERAVFNEHGTVEWEEPFEVAALWSARSATMALLARLHRPLTPWKCSSWRKSSSSTIKRPHEPATLLLCHRQQARYLILAPWPSLPTPRKLRQQRTSAATSAVGRAEKEMRAAKARERAAKGAEENAE